jgi:hypothetical protein
VSQLKCSTVNTNSILLELILSRTHDLRTRDGHANHYSINTALIVYKIQLLMLSYVSNIVFIFFMAGAMTEIRDEIRSITIFLWEFLVCLRSFIVCLWYFFIVVFVFDSMI